MVGALLICAAEKEDGWKMEKQKQKENKEKGREGERKHVRASRHRLQRHHLAGQRDAYVTLINMHNERIMQDV